jgi:predicted Zn finger-like uncharacterized protein
MILTCSACATRYSADPATLGPTGRTVRCAKCGHEWFQAPPADLPKLLLDTTAPADGAATDGRAVVAAAVPQARSGSQGWVSLVLFIVVIGLAAAVVYFGRERIVAAWPPAEQLYRKIGLTGAPLGAGLELSNVTYVMEKVEGQDVMVIQGDIFNTTEAVTRVPSLHATLLDDANKQLAEWVFQMDRSELQPGETASFSTMMRDPPPSSKRVSITFTREPAS